MRSMKLEKLKSESIGSMDSLIMMIREINSEINNSLSITNNHKRQKTIFVIPETKVEEFKKVQKLFGTNSYCYLMTYDEKA